jgi:transaldolase
LLFGLQRYREVAEAFLSALETRTNQNLQINRVASVASFFLSRIDVLVDPMLDKIAERGDAHAAKATELKGRTAVASAKMAYQIYKELFQSDRFRRLAARGARPQRLLWASTGTKNPSYHLKTLAAFRDHGNPSLTLEQEVDQAQRTLDTLQMLGIDIMAVSNQLEDEGVQKFNKPFDSLMASLQRKLESRTVPAQ